MAYNTISVVQGKSFALESQPSSVDLSLDSAVTAGSTLVIMGGAITEPGARTSLLTSVTDTLSHSWATPITEQYLDGAWLNSSSTWASYVIGASAGYPTFTLNLSDVDNRISVVILELSNVDSLDMSVKGNVLALGTSVSTAATGVLTQADNRLVLGAHGWFGIPVNPTGWTSHQSQSNDGVYLGSQVSSKLVSATTSVTGTVEHSSASWPRSAIMLVFKATEIPASGTYKYQFLLDSTDFTSADTAITGYVWRNSGPDGVLAEKYTGLAGDATAGTLFITSVPANVALTDTITGIFYNANDTSGLVTGTVVAA